MKRQKSIRTADSRSERTDEEKLKKFVLYIDFVEKIMYNLFSALH